MNQKLSTPGSQLSSSLRERLKRCGRYHASPKPDTISTTSANNNLSTDNITAKENFPSPQSRKRGSTSPLDVTESNKRTQLWNENPELNASQKIETKSTIGLENSKLDEPINNSTRSDNKQSLTSVSKTPLTSRSRLKQGVMKSNRLIFTKTSTPEKNGNNYSQDSSQNMLTTGTDETSPGASVNEADISATELCPKPCDNGKSSESKTRSDLLKEIAVKEEKLRKLKMVKTYRTKNDLTELQVLIDRWRRVSQQALQDLHLEMTAPKPTLTQLIDHLGIEHDLLNYDPDEETFNE